MKKGVQGASFALLVLSCLTLASCSSTYSIRVDPPDALVLLDGTAISEKNGDRFTLRLDPHHSKKRCLRVEKNGYEPCSFELE